MISLYALFSNQPLTQAKTIAIHCRMGIGRASVLAACILLAQGDSVNEAFACISQAGGLTVPDSTAQVNWLRDFAPQLQLLAT